MGGMPSARGLEWKGDGESRRRYDEKFSAINFSDAGESSVRKVSTKRGVVYKYCPKEVE